MHFLVLNTNDQIPLFLRSLYCSFTPFPEDGAGGEEQTAVTIASVQQASAFGDHNIQYQFRTEGGQVRSEWKSNIFILEYRSPFLS